MKDMKPLKDSALSLVLSGILFVFGFYFLRIHFLNLFNPLYYRVFYMGNSIDFIFGVFSILFFISGISFRCRKNSEDSSLCRNILFGASFAGAVFFISGLSMIRPALIAWDRIEFESPDALENYTQNARQSFQKPVLYFFHADWCLTCDDYERYVLGNPETSGLLVNYLKVKVDVTDYENWHLYMDETFALEAVPSAGIQGKNGRYFRHTNLAGEDVPLIYFRAVLKEGLK